MSESPASSVAPRQDIVLSDGEVDFFWWFIQGSLMDADVRARLYGHWGLCQRHTLAFFVVESAFRPHSIHGCTILYADLMRRALRHLSDEGLHSLVPDRLALHFLRESGPCHVCALGYGPASLGNAPPERLAQGRDVAAATRFATENAEGWLPFVCGVCAGNNATALCRNHLIAAIHEHGWKSELAPRELVRSIASHLERFDDSFRWVKRDTDTVEDRGALIAAMGWCSGWQSLLHGPLRKPYASIADGPSSKTVPDPDFSRSGGRS